DLAANALSGLLRGSTLLLRHGVDAGRMDGHDRRALSVRNGRGGRGPGGFSLDPDRERRGRGYRGRRRAGSGGGRSASDWRHVAFDRTDRPARRVLFRLHPGPAWAQRPGWPHRRGDLERLEVPGDSCGASRFWKRPDDVSARLFFVLCLVTVGAYMGGYHWTEIVVRPALIYPFVFF